MDGDSRSVVDLVAEILSLTSGSGEGLAEEVGVSYASLYAWSRGRRRPSARNARALAEVARVRARRLSAPQPSARPLPALRAAVPRKAPR
jgi:transcriptional regulator with XRE-family HTH domain